MKCKIFAFRSWKLLEEAINAWLNSHAVSPESIVMELAATPHDDDVAQITDYVLVLFYVPMMGVGE